MQTMLSFQQIEQLKQEQKYRNEHNQFIESLVGLKGDSKEGFWALSDMIMNYLFDHANPAVREGMKDLVDECAKVRSMQTNALGATKSLSMRTLFKMPDRYKLALDRVYDGVYPVSTKEFTRGFWHRYPKFRTSDKY